MSDSMSALADALGIEEQDTLYGWGAPHVASLTPPAAGADISWTPSTARACKVLAFSAVLTDSAGAGNRGPSLVLAGPNGTIVHQSGAPQAQPANGVNRISWAVGAVPSAGIAGIEIATIPGLWLPPGSTVSTLTTGIQGADQWSAIGVLYQLR